MYRRLWGLFGFIRKARLATVWILLVPLRKSCIYRNDVMIVMADAEVSDAVENKLLIRGIGE